PPPYISTLSLHDALPIFAKLVQREPDAMIGDAVLRKIVGANFFAAVAGTNHGAALFRKLLLLLLQLHLVEARSQHAHAFLAVLEDRKSTRLNSSHRTSSY